MTIDVLKVSSKSNPNSVAGALAGVARSSGSVEIQVVGAGALNQAVKAIAIARGYMATSGQDLMCRPTFADIRIDGENRTAIRLQVEACAARSGEQASTADSAETAPAGGAAEATTGSAVGRVSPTPVSPPPVSPPPVSPTPGSGATETEGSTAPFGADTTA